MAKRNYTILRHAGRVGTGEPFGTRSRGAAALERAAVPPQPHVEVERMSAKEVRDAARDPGVAAIAPVMPTSLIRPFEADAGAAPSTAWGVSAVRADDRPSPAPASPSRCSTPASTPAIRLCRRAVVEQDFTGAGNGDGQGHGTHCAGTIFGRDVDGTRIGVARGVDPRADRQGPGRRRRRRLRMFFRGIQWALAEERRRDLDVAGVRLPGLGEEPDRPGGLPAELATSVALEAYRGNLRMFDALMEMVERAGAFGQGTVVVAAAGNESQRDSDPDYEIAAVDPGGGAGLRLGGRLAEDAAARRWPLLQHLPAGQRARRRGRLGQARRRAQGAERHQHGDPACGRRRGAVVGSLAPVAGQPQRRRPVQAPGQPRSTVGFAAGTDPADRGMGIVTAPLAAVA